MGGSPASRSRRARLLAAAVTTVAMAGVVAGLVAALATTTATPLRPQPAARFTGGQGYWFVATDGGIFSFGDAGFFGSTGDIRLNQPVVGMAATPSGKGYWFVARDGGIFSFGDAGFHGSTGDIRLNQPIVAMAATPSGNGYWFVAADGGLFAFGDAGFFGSGATTRLNAPVVAMAATPSGKGYWLVGADGAVLAFGDASSFGSLAGTRLNRPIVGMTPTTSGRGYWMVAGDGGMFSFGDAQFFGSTGDIRLNQPIVGMKATPTGGGYWLVAADGGVFSFGDAQFFGSTGDIRLNQPIVGMAATPRLRFNTVPRPAPDALSLFEDQAGNVGVLLNDAGLDDGGVSVTIAVPPAKGTAVVNADRTVRYTPAANATGSDQFTYRVTDADGDSATAVVAVTLLALNDAPTISAIDDRATPEDTATGPIAFTVGDVDTAVAGLSVTVSSSNTALVPNGNLALGGSGASRTVTVTPAANQFGTTTITVAVSDGAASSSETFVVDVSAVNDAPTVSDVADQTTAEDTATGAVALTVADVDNGVDGLTLAGSSSNPALVPDGNIAFGGSGSSRTVTVTPAADQNGTATITVTVSDGAATGSDTFVLTVSPVNDAPVSADQSFSADEDTVVTGTLDGRDPDGSSVTFTAVGLPTGGLVSIAPSTGAFTFTPSADFSGTASFQWKAASLVPPQDSPVATVTIEYAPVNDAPTVSAVADRTIAEDGTTGSVAFTVGDTETAAGSLTVTASSGDTALVPQANVVLGGSGASRTVTVTPAANQTGSATITLTVSDGAASSSEEFVLTVTPVNDPPTLSDVADQATDEDAATAALAVTVGDVETAAGSLTVTASSDDTDLVPNANLVLAGAGGDRTLTVTPAANRSGAATITVTVSDGSATATDTFVLTVAPVDDVPAAVADAASTDEEEGVTVDVLANDGGLGDGGITVAVLAVSDGAASVDGDGRVVYLPEEDFAGTATVSYSVQDADGDSSAATLTVTVDPVNDAPSVTDVPNQSTDEDEPVGPLTFGVADVDDPAASLVVTATSDNTTLVPAANIVVGGAGASRTVTVTPAADRWGVATVTLTVSDGALTDSDSFTVTVLPVNDAPVALDQTFEGDEDVAVTGSLSASDPDGSAVTFATVGAPTGGSVSVSSTTGAFTFTPAADFSGTASFQWKASSLSPAEDSNVATATITLAPVNDAPTVAGAADASTAEDTPTAALGFTVADVDTDVATLTVTGTSSNTVLVPDANIVLGGSGANRTVTVTPAPNRSGSATITLTVSDGSATATDSFVLTVTAVNDVPVALDQSFSADEDTVVTGTLDGGDPDGSSVTFVPVGSPTGGSVVVGPVSGSFTFTPAANFNGVASFQWKATTLVPLEESTVATVTITYAAVNDLPTISAIADQGTDEDTPTGALAFTVGDVETAASGLTVSATSGNTALVPGAGIVLGGSGASRTVTVTPAPDQSGTATITVTVNDGTGTSSETFVLTVTPVNDAPEAADDSVTVALGATVGFDVLANDGDVDDPAGDLTVTLTSSPQRGTLSCSAAGECTYTRTSAGVDTVTYELRDAAGLTSTATITIGE